MLNDYSSGIDYDGSLDSSSNICGANAILEVLRSESIIDSSSLPSYDELIDVGFSDVAANRILDDSKYHCYTDQEMYEVLHSDNPVQAYNDMMEEKAQDAINRADELINRIENNGLNGDDELANSSNALESYIREELACNGDDNGAHDFSFLENSITEKRDKSASNLEDELSNKHIHITGSYGFDPNHGGFDMSTGQKIHDAIVKARGEERITDYTYKRLMDKLDDACYYQ